MEATEIPVLHKYPDDDDRTYPFVLVGRWCHKSLLTTRRFGNEEVAFRSERNMGYSIAVTGYGADGSIVYDADLMSPARHEPETLNKIGGKGAWREMPPTDEQIEESIEAARAAIIRAGEGD